MSFSFIWLNRLGLAPRCSPLERCPGSEARVLRVFLKTVVAAACGAGPDTHRGPPRGAGGQAQVLQLPATGVPSAHDSQASRLSYSIQYHFYYHDEYLR